MELIYREDRLPAPGSAGRSDGASCFQTPPPPVQERDAHGVTAPTAAGDLPYSASDPARPLPSVRLMQLSVAIYGPGKHSAFALACGLKGQRSRSTGTPPGGARPNTTGSTASRVLTGPGSPRVSVLPLADGWLLPRSWRTTPPCSPPARRCQPKTNSRVFGSGPATGDRPAGDGACSKISAADAGLANGSQGGIAVHSRMSAGGGWCRDRARTRRLTPRPGPGRPPCTRPKAATYTRLGEQDEVPNER